MHAPALSFAAAASPCPCPLFTGAPALSSQVALLTLLDAWLSCAGALEEGGTVLGGVMLGGGEGSGGSVLGEPSGSGGVTPATALSRQPSTAGLSALHGGALAHPTPPRPSLHLSPRLSSASDLDGELSTGALLGAKAVSARGSLLSAGTSAGKARERSTSGRVLAELSDAPVGLHDLP